MNTAAADLILPGLVIVSPSSGKRFKVKKVNPKNYRCVDEAGQEWNVRRTPNVRLADDQTWVSKPPEHRTMDEHESMQHLVVGTTVQFTRASDKRKFPGTYVVIGSGSVNHKFAKLGGDQDRFVRGPASLVTVVTFQGGTDENGNPFYA